MNHKTYNQSNTQMGNSLGSSKPPAANHSPQTSPKNISQNAKQPLSNQKKSNGSSPSNSHSLLNKANPSTKNTQELKHQREKSDDSLKKKQNEQRKSTNEEVDSSQKEEQKANQQNTEHVSQDNLATQSQNSANNKVSSSFGSRKNSPNVPKKELIEDKDSFENEQVDSSLIKGQKASEDKAKLESDQQPLSPTASKKEQNKMKVEQSQSEIEEEKADPPTNKPESEFKAQDPLKKPMVLEEKPKQIRMGSEDSSSRVSKLSFTPNIDFFSGKLGSGLRRHTIDSILAKKKDYNSLEMYHDYIQWLFPNKFQSQFNINSQAITEEEIQMFLNDIEVAKRYVQGYEMMLDFYGMKLVSKKTGELKRSDNYLSRYKLAISGHNCLRIRRILTSLNNLGFRTYAIELCEFLRKEIHDKDKPLSARKKDFETGWKQYGKFSTKEELLRLEANTFSRLDELERENIYLTKMNS